MRFEELKGYIEQKVIDIDFIEKEKMNIKIDYLIGFLKFGEKYYIKDIDIDNIEVEYVENYYTESFWNKYNNMIVEFLMSYFLKKKKKTTLKQIEQYIKTNRKI